MQHATEHVARMVAEASGVEVAEALASFRTRAGTEVAEHLFAVASGLDSMVVGSARSPARSSGRWRPRTPTA